MQQETAKEELNNERNSLSSVVPESLDNNVLL